MPWTLALTGRAQRDLDRLPARVVPAIAAFLTGSLLDNPQRVGKPLRRELTGYHSARRGEYRIVYRVDAAQRAVVVVRISHRADVYRRD
ncbi:MAG TPA: type II toxin-antitoxin system RelE/ParE family toxin [Mycobacteriales bacterium]|nr:type II toxin-antitoxin system RelE/ParE family toxin [Mycobacteriales bacterium]